MTPGHVPYAFKLQLDRVIEQFKTLNNRTAIADILAQKAIELARLGDWDVNNRYQG